MDFSNPVIIIALVLSVVILLNFALIARYRQKSGSKENKTSISILDNFRQPWKDEDVALEELAKMVDRVKDKSPENE